MKKNIRLDINEKKLIFRTIIFLIAFIIYLINHDTIYNLILFDIGFFKIYHILWLFLMVEMLIVLIPKLNNYVSCGKCFNKHFDEIKDYDKDKLNKFKKTYNKRAIFTFFLWILLILIIGLLYSNNFISTAAIYLISLFFYFADQFCVVVWCPFRAWLIRNKCCNSCRIYNWGHFMMFCPLVYVVNFWSYSLLIVSIIIFLYWEFSYNLHPERFSEISNSKLRCSNCVSKCRYK